MKNITLALIALLFICGCQKETDHKPLGLKNPQPIMDSASDNNKPLHSGEWRITKQWNVANTTLWCYYDENLDPTSCYDISNTSQDTVNSWEFEIGPNGLILHALVDNVHHNYYDYYPDTDKLYKMYELDGNGDTMNLTTLYWNQALDTVWKNTIAPDTWIQVDGNSNILSQAGSPFTQTFREYENPNPHAHWAPTSFFEVPWDNYNILDTQYDADGEVYRYTAIDSAVDGRVYKYTIGTHLSYNYEWEFFTWDAR